MSGYISSDQKARMMLRVTSKDVEDRLYQCVPEYFHGTPPL